MVGLGVRYAIAIGIVGLAGWATTARAYEVPADFEEALIADHSPETMAAMWYDQMTGINVALGKQASYMPQPDWSYCIDADDPWQLTDGTILFTTHTGLTSSERFNKLRTSPEAVGWEYPASPVHILIDLEQVQAVQRVMVRCQGGIPGVFDFPTRITLVVSEDGINFYRVGEYLNTPGPREGPFANYRMPYLRPYGYYATVFPFVFGELTTKARYVGLEICRRSGLFLDEIAVIAGDFDPATVTYDEQTRYAFPTTGAALIPRDRRLYVPNNVTIFQNLPAYNDLSAGGTDVRWVLELPAGVSLSDEVHAIEPKPDFRTARADLLMPFYDEVTAITRDEQPYTRYVFKYAGTYDRGPEGGGTPRIGPLFFQTELPPGEAGTAYVYAEWDGGGQSPLAIPIEVYAMPAARIPDRLHVSLGWLADFYGIAWPDYVSNYSKSGFNVHPVFPRYWDKGLAGYEGAAAVMENARAAGLAIVYNDSPWCGWLKPAQRDAAYYEQLQQLYDRAALTNPDWIFYDVEGMPAYDPTDPDFVARMLEEGLDPNDPDDKQEMALRLGTETYSDMHDAVTGGMTDAGYAAGPEAGRPLCGSFHFDAAEGVSYWFDYNRLYPDYLQYSMPAYYYAGHAEAIGYELLSVRQAQGSSDIIPWLSTGGDGEFPSPYVRDQALESFLNGCRGITYWSPEQYDGLDFYHHLEAVNIATKIEDVIMDGTVIPPEKLWCLGQRMPVKGLELPDGRAAVLVSSYGSARQVPTPIIEPPGPGLAVPFTSNLQPDTWGRLYYAAGSWNVAEGAATAVDFDAWALYETTTDNGTVAPLTADSDWIVQVIYEEDDSGSSLMFLDLRPGICSVSNNATNNRLVFNPGGVVVNVLSTLSRWHTLTIHYKAATHFIDVYVDGVRQARDLGSSGGDQLEQVYLRGPMSFSHVSAGRVDSQTGICGGVNPGEACAQVRYQIDAPSVVVDLDTDEIIATITPESSIFEAPLDRTVKVFHVRRTVPADFDDNGHVDADDLATFTACMTGPSVQYDPQNLPPACTLAPDDEGFLAADFDSDNDVDQSDFGLFQRCYSGEGDPIDPECANVNSGG